MTSTKDDVFAKLRAGEPAVANDIPPSRWIGGVSMAMEEAVGDSVNEIARLVRTFGGSLNPEYVNGVAFVLAGAANDPARARAVSPSVVLAMELIRVPSPWPRLNLCTAVQRLLMHDALGPELGRPVSGLGRLLRDTMLSTEVLAQAVAAIVLNDLHYAGADDALAPDDRAVIEPLVLGSLDSSNGELAEQAELLRERSQAKT